MIETRIKWRKASEELPEYSGDVLVVSESDTVTMLSYSSKYKLFNIRDYYSGRRALKLSIPVKYWTYASEFFELFSDE